jgi:acetyl esterase/lipase
MTADDILSRLPPAADERVPYGDGSLQFGDLRLPAGSGPHPLLIVVHGGFWRARHDLSYMGFACEALRAAGIATWNVEYRRIGDEGSGWPGTFLDVAAAADAVRGIAARYPLDLARVAAMGHSAGGHLALWLAGRHRLPIESPLASPDPLPLNGAVSLAGVCDLHEAWTRRLSGGVVRDLLGGTPDEVPERYNAASPAALLPLGVRQWLLHGTADANVPYALSAEYAHRAETAGDDVKLVTLPEAGHFDVVDPTSAEWVTVVGAARLALGSDR